MKPGIRTHPLGQNTNDLLCWDLWLLFSSFMDSKRFLQFMYQLSIDSFCETLFYFSNDKDLKLTIKLAILFKQKLYYEMINEYNKFSFVGRHHNLSANHIYNKKP